MAECITITGDKVLARDLAKAIPEFGLAPQDEVLSFAPIPGLTRTFKPSEIAGFALRLKTPLVNEDPRTVCVVSAAAVLTEGKLRDGVLTAVPYPVVSLKILDFSRAAMPPGRLEFRETGLAHSSLNTPGTVVWHGRVVTDSGRSFPVWAKLSLIVQAKTVVSSRNIEKGRRVTLDDVGYLNETTFPLPEGVLTSLDEAIGRSAVRNLEQGTPMLKWMLQQPQEVVQGQIVHVDAVCGDAHLSFEAQAQNSGRRGDEITVRNPNGRSFRARVIDKDHVEVRSAGGN